MVSTCGKELVGQGTKEKEECTRKCEITAHRLNTSETEANRSAVQTAFEAWQNGTGSITEIFAPEMVWRIEGHSLASKFYESKQQFIDEVLTPFGERFESSDKFRPIRIRSINADGDTVIVLWDGRGMAVDGLPYENS